MKILFATNNAHKLTEVQAVLGDAYTLVTPRDCGVTEEIPEEQETLEGNASQKAHYLHDRTGLDCFADDTGLEVEALGGAPGVHSARYATDGHDFAANNRLLLRNLEGAGRSFRCFSAARSTCSKASSKGGSSTARPDTRDSATTRCSCPTATRKPSPR